ncbi:MAG: PAS domain S-box protein [candidate division Zixibacteria bacterium]|nr:PAS domain S-box protein [candidate division Zixibacteria bacterium]
MTNEQVASHSVATKEKQSADSNQNELDSSCEKHIDNPFQKLEVDYESLYNATHEAIMILDNSGFTDCNNTTLQMFGYSTQSEFCSLHPGETSPAVQPDGQDSMTLANKQISTAMSKGHNKFKWVHKRKNGEEFPAEVSLSKIEIAEKPFILAIVRDITEEHKEKESLSHKLNIERSLSYVAQVLASSSDDRFDNAMQILGKSMATNRAYIFEYNSDGKKISCISEWCNPDVSAQKGDLQNLNTSDFSWWITSLNERGSIVISDVETLPPEAKNEKEVLQAQSIRSLLVVPILSFSGLLSGFIGFDDTNGTREWLEDDIVLLKVVASLVSFELEREKITDALSRTISQYTAMINTVPAKMYLKDIDHKYITVNDAFCALVGKSKSQIEGKTDYDIFPPDKADIYFESDRIVMDEDKKIISQQEEVIDADGVKRWVSTTKIPLHDNHGLVSGIVGLVQDITEQQQSREKLAQSDKLAAIGTLAAGVAHEINNPVGFISSNLNTMKKYVDKISKFITTLEGGNSSEQKKIDFILEDFTDAIEESVEGTTRVKNIVADLKSFSRVDKAEKGNANLNEGIESTLNIVWNELKYKCKVEKNFGDIPDLYCIPNQLNQVFMNILINAGHAIEHNDGLIQIETKATDKNIIISFKDNGKGIPRENIGKLFEPFFTTKEVGKGTGLGLSLAYDIITKHGGNIDVKSEVGEGTEFIVNLPLEGISND